MLFGNNDRCPGFTEVTKRGVADVVGLLSWQNWHVRTNDAFRWSLNLVCSESDGYAVFTAPLCKAATVTRGLNCMICFIEANKQTNKKTERNTMHVFDLFLLWTNRHTFVSERRTRDMNGMQSRREQPSREILPSASTSWDWFSTTA